MTKRILEIPSKKKKSNSIKVQFESEITIPLDYWALKEKGVEQIDDFLNMVSGDCDSDAANVLAWLTDNEFLYFVDDLTSMSLELEEAQ